jgi:hypothetical protein
LRFFWLMAKPGSHRSSSVRQFGQCGFGAYSATCGAILCRRSSS